MRPRRYLATGAGERLTPLPAAGALRRARAARRARGSSTADVYREADRLGLPRDAAGLAARAARGRRTAAGDLPGELLVNDLEPAARALCPAIDDALAAARGAGADHALVCGSGPTVVGLFADLQGARGAAARLLRPRPAPDRRRAVGGDAVKPVWLVFAAALLAVPRLAPAAPRADRCWPAARSSSSARAASTASASSTCRTSSNC